MRIVVVGGGPAGLYFAILARKGHPEREVVVYERNRADDTFGFGVVFSDETLDGFLRHDPESYAAIAGQFAYWDEIDFAMHGETVRSVGHGFCGCGRAELLAILQRRCLEVGVDLRFGTESPDPRTLAREADLLVGADGINSRVREAYADRFRPDVRWRKNRFAWLGATRPYDAFTFDFTEDGHGIWVLGAYQYKAGMATWVVEAPERTWESAKGEIEHLADDTMVAYMERLWADRLDGGRHRLVSNRSVWRRFPMIRCAGWHHGNVVLIGDALHTAHYSIGSGTKLAMEDAIALHEALESADAVAPALSRFEEMRREEVEKTQHASEVSVTWTEEPHRYWSMSPVQGAFSMLSRSKQVTYENLRLRDPDFIDAIDGWFAGTVRAKGFDLPENDPPPPMFTPFALRGMTLRNRVVVSPMDMYSATEGVPGDFHFVHLGSMALGGAGLVFSEMACVSAEGRITPGCTGLYAPEHVAAWAKLIGFVHENSDAKFCLQIGHAGRKGSTRRGWEGMDAPLAAGNWEVIAPSAVAHKPGMHVPREMTRADMDRVRDDFVRAARMADEAGADMIELHAAHGYLLSSFITPVANRRTDAYGGPLENRLRFPLEVFDAVRAAWPADRPVSVRISATDWIGDDGVTGEEAVEIARAFRAHGCDIIDVSAGQTSPDAKPVYGRMFQTPFSEQVRNEAGIPTIAVGNITTADQVNTIVAAGRADLVALARPHLANPHFTLEASAWYGHRPQRWPIQYEAAKEQAFRLAERERADALALRKAAAPSNHRA
ncbi:MAG: bifunctional salicylyl-CoA 5-hydroxylase/oxidoreductase [Rhodospirillaceae bacterium]